MEKLDPWLRLLWRVAWLLVSLCFLALLVALTLSGDLGRRLGGN